MLIRDPQIPVIYKHDTQLLTRLIHACRQQGTREYKKAEAQLILAKYTN